MTLPRRVWRVPQRSASCATRYSPRPPSSVSAARRGRGEVSPASETSQISAVVQQHPRLDGLSAVADGVGHQLAEDQLGVEGEVLHVPGGEPLGDLGAHVGDHAGSDARSQEATWSAGAALVRATSRVNVVGAVVARDGVQYGGAVCSAEPPGWPRALAQAPVWSGRRLMIVDDQSVAVQDEPAALGEFHLGRLEGGAAEAERLTPRAPPGTPRAVRVDDRGWRMAGAGQGAALGGGVVDRVRAGRAGDAGVRARGRRSGSTLAPVASFPAEAADQLVQMARISPGGMSSEAKLSTAVRRRPCRPHRAGRGRRRRPPPGRPGPPTGG